METVGLFLPLLVSVGFYFVFVLGALENVNIAKLRTCSYLILYLVVN